jgi:acylpyruvate hydrolase
VERDRVSSPQNLEIRLKVNGQLRQQSNTCRMLFPIDRVIEYVSSVFTIERGDLIFTGTPEGVGPVVSGDVLEADLESVGTLTIIIG